MFAFTINTRLHGYISPVTQLEWLRKYFPTPLLGAYALRHPLAMPMVKHCNQWLTTSSDDLHNHSNSLP